MLNVPSCCSTAQQAHHREKYFKEGTLCFVYSRHKRCESPKGRPRKCHEDTQSAGVWTARACSRQSWLRQQLREGTQGSSVKAKTQPSTRGRIEMKAAVPSNAVNSSQGWMRSCYLPGLPLTKTWPGSRNVSLLTLVQNLRSSQSLNQSCNGGFPKSGGRACLDYLYSLPWCVFSSMMSNFLVAFKNNWNKHN